MAASFAVNTPGGQVRLSDLPFEAFERLCEETGESWTDILTGPGRTPRTVLAVYRLACERTASTPEELTPAKLLDGDGIFVLVDDEMPIAWNTDSALPESEGAAETSLSSGAPEPTDGSPTK